MYSILYINADFQGGSAPLLLMFRGALAPMVPTPVVCESIILKLFCVFIISMEAMDKYN